jgi:predicted dehydrogenase
MDGKVGWGFVGTGKIARILAGALSESADGELVAVGSRDLARASAFAADFGMPRVLDYQGVVQDPGVDLVYVATHNPLHSEWAIRAIEAGKGVLCEKPIGMSSAEAAEITETARRRDAFLMEAFAYRCHPQTARLVRLLAGGVIGDVRMIDAVFGYDAGPEPDNYLFDLQLGGGAILDVGCYPTSMAHLIAAASGGAQVAPAVDVAAAGTIGPTGVDLTSAATLTFGDGLLARVACSIQANLENSVRIFGSEGSIEVGSPWLPGWHGPEPSIRLMRWGAAPELIEIANNKDVYRLEVDTVSQLFRSGERSPAVMRWEDSVTNMATLDRWRSAIGPNTQ